MQNRRYLFLILLLILGAALYISIGSLRPQPKNPSEDARQIIKECQEKKAEKEPCYIEKFTDLTKKNPIEYSLKTLSLIREAGGVANGCHFIAHVMATAEVRKNPPQWEDVLSKISTSDCTGGFIMGAIEGHKLYDRAFVLDASSLSRICRKVIERTAGYGDDQTCAHTMGHLLLVDTKGSLATATRVCDSVQKEYQYECYAGVFMENLYRRNLFVHGVGKSFAWNKKTLAEQEELCSSYPYLPAKACWRQLSHMYVVLEKEPQKVFAACSRTGREDFRDACYFHAVGVMTLLSGDSAKLRPLCVPYSDSPDKFSSCTDVIVSALLDSSLMLFPKASEFCKSLSDQYRKPCMDILEIRKRSFGPELSKG